MKNFICYSLLILFSGCVFRVNNSATTAKKPTTTTPTFCSTYTQIGVPPFQSDYLPTPDGTFAKPYHLCNVTQFQYLMATAGMWTLNFKLEDDIDLSTVTTMTGTANCGAFFRGNLNGNNKTLSNYSCTIANGCSTAGTDYVGLFKCVTGDGNDDGTTDGIIKDLTLKNFTVQGRNYVGALVGSNGTQAKFTNITVNSGSSSTGSDHVGGVFGYNSGTGTVTNVVSSATVSGTNFIGGVSGTVDSTSTYTNVSHNTGLVTGSGTSIGGLIGSAADAIIINCFNTANVTGTGAATIIGGLVGYQGDIRNSYATGTVTGGTGNSVGGLVGQSYKIDSSYSTATVDAPNAPQGVGGLTGIVANFITNSYSTGAVSGGQMVGGLAGSSGNNVTISNSWSTSTITSSNHYIGGLVGIATNTNLVIQDSYYNGTVSGQLYVGGIVGDQGHATGSLLRVHSSGTVISGNSYAGGLAGRALGTITDSYSTATVTNTGGVDVGGLVGRAGGNITGSYHRTGVVTGGGYVGGLVGEGLSGTYSRNFSAGTVLGPGGGVGGFIGLNTAATIVDCYSTGTVTGTPNAGGFVGQMSGGSITTSYAANTMGAGAQIGGFSGNDVAGAYSNNYWDLTLNPALNDSGSAGNIANVTSASTANMQLAATFTGFNFGVTWVAPAGDYPKLGFE